MKLRQLRAFTLIELMVVLVLIAILAAVTVPKLTEVSNRNTLGEVANLFQRTVADAKALAVKSRRAVVVEVRNDSMWINLLATPQCDSAIRNRCFHNFGAASNSANTNVIDLNTEIFRNAGVDMCDLRVAVMADSGGTLTCTIKEGLAATGVGLCFNGSGQLWIRSTTDPATTCSAGAATPVGVWEKGCVPWKGTGVDISATETEWFSGADVRFNRFTAGTGVCSPGADSLTPSGAEGITRRVIVPAGGHPFVKMGEAGK